MQNPQPTTSLSEVFIYEGRSNGIQIYGHSPLICPRHSAVFGLVHSKKKGPSLGREGSCVDICGGVCHDGDIATVTVVFTPSDRMVLQILNTRT